MAALEIPTRPEKYGVLAAQAAARAEQSDEAGFREVQNVDHAHLPGPAAAGLAMRYSGSPALLARFRQIQRDTASAMNKASSEGQNLVDPGDAPAGSPERAQTGARPDTLMCRSSCSGLPECDC